MGVLTNIKPENVFKVFEEICSIPHGSGNLDKISAYCADFASRRGFEHFKDEYNNVVIWVPASKGYEKSETVILQSHLDMVCEKNDDIDFDFEKDGLVLKTDGKLLMAEGTTLGGDDGIGVAMMLALADEDMAHPPLELVFTADEETSMDGAFNLDYSRLKGRTMINLDSEDEGIITVSSAGGADAIVTLGVSWEQAEGTAITTELSCLTGGHSGMEIHKGLANANVLMARLLTQVAEKYDIRIAELTGGSKANAIPVYAKSVIIVKNSDLEGLMSCLNNMVSNIKSEHRTTDPEMIVNVSSGKSGIYSALSAESSSRLANLINSLPNGVQSMSPDMPGLVQTSVNLAIVEIEGQKATIINSVRSCVESQKKAILNKIQSVGSLAGAVTQIEGNYPGWRYEPYSPLRDVVTKAYKETSGKEPTIEAIHAGLECGLFADRIQGLDCVSVGPDMRNVHTPSEFLDIASCERFYELLKKVLAMCG